MITLCERRSAGVFNATGPATRMTFGTMLDGIAAAVQSPAELVWVAEDGLAAAGVEPWQDLPLWLDLERHPT